MFGDKEKITSFLSKQKMTHCLIKIKVWQLTYFAMQAKKAQSTDLVQPVNLACEAIALVIERLLSKQTGQV